MNTYWLKYRTRWSSGPLDWEYIYWGNLELKDLPSVEDAIEFLGIHDKNAWSDHYRGTEEVWVEGKEIPRDYLEAEILKTRKIVESQIGYENILTEILKSKLVKSYEVL